MFIPTTIPLEEQQQILLDNDFDEARPHWVEEFLARRRDAEELDTLGY